MTEDRKGTNMVGVSASPAPEAAKSAHAASRLSQVFEEAARPLLIPYAVGGYPDLAGCARILETYHEAGADIIEIGIPFSDPLADGPVIQSASTIALNQGVRPGDVLDLAEGISKRGARVVLLTYLNTILAYGPDRFFARCDECGVLGVVVPDVPVEEASDLQAAARRSSVDIVLLVAPTSTEARITRIADAASGFIYCVSTTGVTGARASLRADLPAFLARVRSHTDLPLAVGFGVSTVEHVAAVAPHADGVIIGSALVQMVTAGLNLESGLEKVREFVTAARKVL